MFFLKTQIGIQYGYHAVLATQNRMDPTSNAGQFLGTIRVKLHHHNVPNVLESNLLTSLK